MELTAEQAEGYQLLTLKDFRAIKSCPKFSAQSAYIARRFGRLDYITIQVPNTKKRKSVRIVYNEKAVAFKTITMIPDAV